MTEANGPRVLEARRLEYHLDVLKHVHRLLEREQLQHVLVLTQVLGSDVQVHSSWSSKIEELWLLARAQHLLNRVIDGEVDPRSLDSGAS